MTVTVKQLVAPTALTNTLNTTLYTVPASTTAIVKEILLCNTDTASRDVTVYLNGNGVANTILDAVPVLPGETKFITLSTVLVATNTLRAGASTGSVVSISVSGVEVT